VIASRQSSSVDFNWAPLGSPTVIVGFVVPVLMCGSFGRM
jgi:hypothetical protein